MKMLIVLLSILFISNVAIADSYTSYAYGDWAGINNVLNGPAHVEGRVALTGNKMVDVTVDNYVPFKITSTIFLLGADGDWDGGENVSCGQATGMVSGSFTPSKFEQGIPTAILLSITASGSSVGDAEDCYLKLFRNGSLIAEANLGLEGIYARVNAGEELTYEMFAMENDFYADWVRGYDRTFIFTIEEATPEPATIYVDFNTPNYPGTGTKENPYSTIQAGIDASSSYDTVVVAPGRYYENLILNRKAIVITSTVPEDPEVVASTIIDGNHIDTVIKIIDANNMVIEGFTITNGLANTNGGGIYCEDSNVVLSLCIITGNRTTDGKNTDIEDLSDGGDGAGIYCTSSSITITNCNIIGNTTGEGGILNVSDYYYTGGNGGDGAGLYGTYSSLIVNNCIINNNTTGKGRGIGMGGDRCPGGKGGNGAGIYSTSSTLVTINNCSITNNRTGEGGYSHDGYGNTGGDGGGIYCYSVTITNTKIKNNSTGNGAYGEYGGDTSGGDGGGIYCVSDLIKIKNCDISENMTGSGNFSDYDGTDGGSGGGIYCASSATPSIVNCIITNNRTGNGGSVSFYESPLHSGNGGNGAGIFCHSGTIRNCVISGNITGLGGDNYGTLFYSGYSGYSGNGGNGGGIYSGGSQLLLSNCALLENRTGNGGFGHSGALGGNGGNGAGIHCNTATLSNCTLSVNVAGTGGLTEWPEGSDGNTGVGGAIWSGLIAITDSILWGNIPTPLIQTCSTVTYSNIEGGYAGTGNFSNEPRFADPNNGDYHLKSQYGRWSPALQSWMFDDVTSPCIDTGDPADPNWMSEPWPHGRRINMGAYGGTLQASMSASNEGNIADLDNSGMVDFRDYCILAGDWYGTNSYTIPKGQIDVDGNIIDWSDNIEWININKIYSGDPCDIIQAKFALRWNPDTDKLYVAVIIEDAKHVFTDSYQTWSASDRLELYSQGDAAGGNYIYLQDIAQQYIVASDTSGGSWATLGFGEPNISPTGFEYAAKVKGDFIIYEAGIRQFDNYGGLSGGETIVTELNVDDVVRFDIVADTRWSSTGFGMLSENQMLNKFRIADNIAQYKLVDKINTPPCLELKGDLDRNCILDWSDIIFFCNNWLEVN